MLIVDAHPPIYSADRRRYPTIDDPWEPGEPATAEDLRRRMAECGVARAVFIQTSTFYGVDNGYICDSALANREWATGVVTLDPDDGGSLAVLERAVTSSNVRGVRGIPDSADRIDSAAVRRLWAKAAELKIVVNCMVLDAIELVGEILAVAASLPALRIVIDHCLMLSTAGHDRTVEATLEALEALAQAPNVYAKLTCGTHGSSRVYLPHPHPLR